MNPSILRRTLQLSVVVAWTLFGASTALASITFPPVIQSELSLAGAPECTLCHRSDLGGVGTVVRPFGRTMMTQFGLMSGNIAALRAGLAGSEAAQLDSDGDGTSDIDELRMGSDPNVGVSGMEAAPEVPLPQTGCALSAPSPTGGGAALAIVLLGLALRRRGSARATRSSRIRNRTRIAAW
ncbi:MAG TPA: thrombospondin type 3 repeat-containing protein [Polyangiaceae bacterium]